MHVAATLRLWKRALSLLFELNLYDGSSFCSMHRYLAESKENGPNGTYKVYAISSVAIDEVQEDKLTAFIDGVSSLF